MAEKRIAARHHATFEGLRQLDEHGNEFWLARQLAGVLEYSQYRHFLPVIERAKEACINSGQTAADHFEDILNMVEIGSGAKRQIEDLRLSRYACYLIVQNADPSKPIVANGQTYSTSSAEAPLTSLIHSSSSPRIPLRRRFDLNHFYLAANRYSEFFCLGCVTPSGRAAFSLSEKECS